MGNLAHIQMLPSSEEVAFARQSSQELAAYLTSRKKIQHIQILDERGAAHPVQIPVIALKMLVQVLIELSNGNAVGIIPIHAEMTTQEAADLLNVSRPYLVQLLERGDIPFHKVGAHRRVRYDDVVAYKARIDEDRRKALDELAELSQKLNMGYE